MARGRPRGGASATKAKAGSALGFEATLWAAADKLRGNMDAAEYKHVVLGLIFLKYISDRFAERQGDAAKEAADAGLTGAAAEAYAAELAADRDFYTAENVFWVPEEARWDWLKARATSVQPTIGESTKQCWPLSARMPRSRVC